MRQWLRKFFGLFVLAGVLVGLGVWIYGFPSGSLPCGGREREIYVDNLEEQGYSVVCRKEGDVTGSLKFRMQLWQQFIEWTRTHRVITIYEQPGYFWFLIPAGTLGAEGFVFYEYH